MAYDIRIVKLVNGDIAIGKWEEKERKLKEPASIQTLPTQGGGIQMMLLPFGYPFDTKLEGEISLDHVLFEFKNTPEELKNKYLEASTNLTISTASDLRNLERMTGEKGGISDLLLK